MTTEDEIHTGGAERIDGLLRVLDEIARIAALGDQEWMVRDHDLPRRRIYVGSQQLRCLPPR